jgi:DNA-binding protein H-NS
MTQELNHATQTIPDRDTMQVLLRPERLPDGDDTDMAQTKARDKDLADLIKQRRNLEEQIRELREEAVATFKAEVEARAAELEVNIIDLFQPQKKGKGKGISSGVPKYTDGKGNYWGGRGRPAAWMQELLDQGHDKDEFISPDWTKANA